MSIQATIMKSAWKRYRQVAFRGRAFNRATFGAVLRFEWKRAKADAVYARVQAEDAAAAADAPALVAPIAKPMSEMERRIDELKYLPFRYSASAAEAAIRAEYAHA